MADFKIGFNYNLPSGFPITLKDIECLELLKADALGHIYFVLGSTCPEIKKEDMPAIFISDGKPVRLFGNYSWEDIKSEIKNIIKKVSQIENPYIRGAANELLEQIKGLVEKMLSANMRSGAKAEHRTMLKDKIKKLGEELSQCDEDGYFKDAIEKLQSHIINIKHKASIWGTYSPMNNMITLYVNNILDYCEKNLGILGKLF